MGGKASGVEEEGEGGKHGAHLLEQLLAMTP